MIGSGWCTPAADSDRSAEVFLLCCCGQLAISRYVTFSFLGPSTAAEDLVRSVALDEGKWRARYGFAKPRPDTHLIIYTTPEQKAKVLPKLCLLCFVLCCVVATSKHSPTLSAARCR